MSRVFMIADCHFGHANIAKYRPKFKTVEEHDEYVLSVIKSTVGKRDTLYFLGDICFTIESLEFINQIACRKKVLVLGNHDAERHGMKKEMLHSVFDDVVSLIKYKGCWLSHCPIHPEELRGKFNIHGHTHNHVIDDHRYANVSLENIDYKPVEFTAIRDTMELGKVYGVLGPQNKPHFEGLEEDDQ